MLTALSLTGSSVPCPLCTVVQVEGWRSKRLPAIAFEAATLFSGNAWAQRSNTSFDVECLISSCAAFTSFVDPPPSKRTAFGMCARRKLQA
jgi:hypothetical protein